MAVRKAEAHWEGSVKEGRGRMKFGSGAYDGAYTWSSRFEEEPGTNPEELIGAAHAGCFSMALASDLGKAGFTPETIDTTATVTLGRVEGKARILSIHLDTTARVPNVDEATFQQIANGAKQGCPVSAALTGTEITLDAKLVQ